jgi:RNA polymerase sigma-70 factor (ECF subfamily)
MTAEGFASFSAGDGDKHERDDGEAVHRELEASDEEIVAVARTGGTEALRRASAAALRRYFRDLYAHVRGRLPRDEAAVEDVLQEVALAVVEGLPRVRSGAALRAWLLQVASHKVLDHLRRRGRDLARGGDLGEALLEHLADEQGSMDRLLERAGEEELAAYVRRTLDRLRPRQRQAVELVYFEGLPAQEAALRMNLRADALAALLYRARRSFGRLVRRDRRPGATESPALSLAPGVRKC